MRTKAIDNAQCLNPGDPLMPRPELAPLITLDQKQLEDMQLHAILTDASFDKPLVLLRLAVRELDAQRRAHATAYAEGQRAALQSAMHIAVTCNRDDRTADEIAGEIQRKLLALIRALRDTPAPRREDA
jgi:hypothetical protein